MNQVQLQQLVEDRLLDAAALLVGQRWSFAYYVAGYAVECALKSCVLAQMVRTGWVFDEDNRNKKIGEVMTHDFVQLMSVAGIKGDLDTALANSAAAGGEFMAFWGRVQNWKPTSRYEMKTMLQANELNEAITDPHHGVMQWLRNYW